MKVAIRQKVLMEALNKGAAAAISEAAQTDTTNFALLVQSAKITIGENLVVESITNIMAPRFTMEAKEENGVKVQEEGTIVVSAKELIDWVKAQDEEATIGIQLNKLAKPEYINMTEDEDDDDSFSVRKIGTVKIAAKDDKKLNSKWELDCFDPDQMPQVDFSKKKQKIFDITADNLEKTLAWMALAASKKDADGIFDAVSIQPIDNKIHFAATDTHRCSLGSSDTEDNQLDGKLLITIAHLAQAAKLGEKGSGWEVHYNDDINRTFLVQPNLEIRIATVDKDVISKFPDLAKVVSEKCSEISTVNRGALMRMLSLAAIVNDHSALFTFKTDGVLTVKAISETGKYKPSVGKISVAKPNEDIERIWGVKHMIDGLKAFSSDEVTLSVPSSGKFVQISGKDDPEILYFAMRIDNPLYAKK